MRALRGRGRVRFGTVAAAALATAAAVVAVPGAGVAQAAVPQAAGTYSVVDLGTLGGKNSKAVALDNHTVVGESQLAGSKTVHAFAYDLAVHDFTDLGTLGGANSSAVGLNGRYVAGNSDVAGSAAQHGFVYDLGTDTLTDLGTLGGSTSKVTAISGNLVLGSSTTEGDAFTHGFVYDLSSRELTDVGSLAPGDDSAVAGVGEDGVVLGNSTPHPLPGHPANGPSSPFAYDLNTGVRTALDLPGSLRMVRGNTAVGTIRDPKTGDRIGYAYDLDAGTYKSLGRYYRQLWVIRGNLVAANDSALAAVYDLGTGASTVIPTHKGVAEPKYIGRDGLIVGDAYPPNSLAFVWTVGATAVTWLPSLGGRNSEALQVNGKGVVVGSAALPPTSPADANGPFHAVIWVPQAAGTA